jgi:hypothetical protein
LERKYQCDFSGEQTYEKVTSNLAPQEKRELDFILKRIFNVLESTSIQMEKRTVNKNICYHTLNGIFLTYHNWGRKYLDQVRRNDKEIFWHVARYAEKWETWSARKRWRRDLSAKIIGWGVTRLQNLLKRMEEHFAHSS